MDNNCDEYKQAREADRGLVDQEVVEVDEVLEQAGDVRRVVVQLADGVTKQVQRLERLEPAQVDQLQRVQSTCNLYY